MPAKKKAGGGRKAGAAADKQQPLRRKVESFIKDLEEQLNAFVAQWQDDVEQACAAIEREYRMAALSLPHKTRDLEWNDFFESSDETQQPKADKATAVAASAAPTPVYQQPAAEAVGPSSSAHVHEHPGPVARTFNVAVIGLSGTEKIKGAFGVGKSCLCNRFVRPLEDEYDSEHVSTLSQADFSQSAVINSVHWLYWGERALLISSPNASTSDPQQQWLFKVVEQTEFVDDESFQCLPAKLPYAKRVQQTQLQSPEKLMYICTAQLGLECEYEQRLVSADGRINIDGFICCYDVSSGGQTSSGQRSFASQSAFLAPLLQSLLKSTKKPVVIATTKHDEANEDGLKAVQDFVNRKELRSYNLPVVQTSAKRAINADVTFALLGHLVDKLRTRPKIQSFRDVDAVRAERCRQIDEAFRRRLAAALPSGQKLNRPNWQDLVNLLQYDHDFLNYCDVFGSRRARQLYQQHVRQLRDEWQAQLYAAALQRLPAVFNEMMPTLDTVPSKRWQDVHVWLQRSYNFDSYFIPCGTYGSDDARAEADQRIPAEVLLNKEAANVFHKHVAKLEDIERKHSRLVAFEQLLSECSQVTPGRPLNDAILFLMGADAYEALEEQDVVRVYDAYQRQLVTRAKSAFVELLLENVDQFLRQIRAARPPRQPSSGIVDLTDKQLKAIQDVLEEDVRYRHLNRMFNLRDNMVAQYTAFVQYPIRSHCPAGDRCADALIEHTLSANALLRPDSSASSSPPALSPRPPHQLIHSQHSPRTTLSLSVQPHSVGMDQVRTDSARLINLAILSTDGLADQLIREMNPLIPGNVYHWPRPNLPTSKFRFRLHTIDATMCRQSGHIFLDCDLMLLVYSSRSNLHAVRDCVQASTDHFHRTFARQHRLPPLAVTVAADPNFFDELPYLQQQGAELAHKCSCPFVALGRSSTPGGGSPAAHNHTLPGNDTTRGPHLFSRDQLARLLDVVADRYSAVHDEDGPRANPMQYGTVSPPIHSPIQQHPPLSVLMSVMCGDEYPLSTALAPLLSRQVNTDQPNVRLSTPAMKHLQSATFAVEMHVPLSRPTSTILSDKSSTSISDNADNSSTSSSVKHLVHVTVLAAHTAVLVEPGCFDAAVMVYSMRRRASYAATECLLNRCLRPVWGRKRTGQRSLIMAVGETTEFFSDAEANQLITAGNQLADACGARFVTVSPAQQPQIGTYSAFFGAVLADQINNELNGHATDDDDDDDYASLTGESPTADAAADSRLESPTTAAAATSFETPPSSKSCEFTHNADGMGELSMKDSGVVFDASAEPSVSSVSDQSSAATTPATAPLPSHNRHHQSAKHVPTTRSAGGLTTVTTTGGGNTTSTNPDDLSALSVTDCDNDVFVYSPTVIRQTVDADNLHAKTVDSQGSGLLTSSTSSGRPPVLSSASHPADQSSSDDQQTTSTHKIVRRLSDGQIIDAPSAVAGEPNSEATAGLLGSRTTVHKTTSASLHKHACNNSMFNRKPRRSKQSIGEQMPNIGHMMMMAVPQMTTPIGPTGDMARMLTSVHADATTCTSTATSYVSQLIPRSASEESLLDRHSNFADKRRERLNRSRRLQAVNGRLAPWSTDSQPPDIVLSSDVRTDDETPTSAQEEQSPPPANSFVRKVASSFRHFHNRHRSASARSPRVADLSARRPGDLSTAIPDDGLFDDKIDGGQLGEISTANGWFRSKSYGRQLAEARLLRQETTSPLEAQKDSVSSSSGASSAGKSTGFLFGKSSPATRKMSPQEMSKKKPPSSGSPVVPAGCTLADLSAATADQIPLFVRKCIQFIEREGGLTMEGLYRVPGNQAQMAELEQKFAKSLKADGTCLDFGDLDLPVNVVASALKNFFTCLPEPVIPADIYDSLMSSLDSPDRLDRIRQLFEQKLPRCNAVLLLYFLRHLARVAANADKNCMDAKNLAKCWWPTLLKPDFASFDSMGKMVPKLEEFTLILLHEHESLLHTWTHQVAVDTS